MKEFVEKLIGRLEEESKESKKQYQKFLDDNECGRAEGFEIAIEIVNQLAEEYKEKDCSKCSRRSWYQKGYADAEKKFAEEYGKDTNVTTNADFIRKMNDEELAELFMKLAWNGEVQTTPLRYLDWLKSEVKGSE